MDYTCPDCGKSMVEEIPSELQRLMSKHVLVSEMCDPGGRELVFASGVRVHVGDMCDVCDHKKIYEALKGGVMNSDDIAQIEEDRIEVEVGNNHYVRHQFNHNELLMYLYEFDSIDEYGVKSLFVRWWETSGWKLFREWAGEHANDEDAD